MSFADQGELGHKIVAENWQHLRIQAIGGQLFDVHVMVREAVMFEREIGCVAPAVHLARQEGDAFGGSWLAHESREVSRQRGESQLIDGTVAFIIPGDSQGGTELEDHEEGQGGSR